MVSFSTSAFLAACFSSFALAQTVIPITVGGAGLFQYTPDSVNASVGDVIMFQFESKNHSATQSSFAAPCTPLSGGASSGFRPTTSDTAFQNDATLNFNFTVSDASKPLWFHCEQTNPFSHCERGMVFAINAPAFGTNTFAAFQAAAIALNTSASSPSNSNTNTPSNTDTGPPNQTVNNKSPSNTGNSAQGLTAGAGGILAGIAGMITLLI